MHFKVTIFKLQKEVASINIIYIYIYIYIYILFDKITDGKNVSKNSDGSTDS